MNAKAGKGVVRANHLTDSSHACSQEDFVTLRIRLERDGYIFLREFLPETSVNKVSRHDRLSALNNYLLLALLTPMLDATILHFGQTLSEGQQ